MNLQLTGKRAVVTGASSDIGWEVVQLLRAEGVRVVAACRTRHDELKDAGAIPIGVDLTDPGAATWLAVQATYYLHDVDFLVNCVGGVDPAVALSKTIPTSELSEQIFTVNVRAPMCVAQALLPSLRATRGAMVHIAALGAHQAGNAAADYTIAKSSLIAASRSLAAGLAPYRVRSNTISPGPVASRAWTSWAAARGQTLDELFTDLPAMCGMSTGEMIAPAEVAALAVYLLSPHATGITGADLPISGGLGTTLPPPSEPHPAHDNRSPDRRPQW